ncbi:MAG: pullulanase-type alpha-1,6-glucosidase [Acidobacteriota bacterium]
MTRYRASRLAPLAAAALAILGLVIVPWALATEQPGAVTVAGSLQEELGCPGDWQPDCPDTQLTYDEEDTVWQGIFDVPAGDWEYKAPINNAWDENYGLGAVFNGDNIPLSLAEPTAVKFYYSHETHWITDNVNSVIAVAPGSFQSELGCSGDWQPWCLRSWLQDPDGDGTFIFRTGSLPAGDYEVKVAHNESWDENYGAGGVQGGPNIPFSVPADCSDIEFSYDLASNLLSIDEATAAPQPNSVTIAGSFQEEVGCPGDWQPDCAVTHLDFDAEDQVWQGTFDIPAGAWEYKAPINDSWDENYGANAAFNGANIALDLGEATEVKFYFDSDTKWVTDNVNAPIFTIPGSFQSELGCADDWQPWCLRSWLQDPDGDGVYTFSTSKLPAGNYEAKVAVNESWDLNYGADGAQNGANIAFTVPSSCTEIFFVFDSTTNVLTIGTEGGPRGNLALAQSHFVEEDLLAWNFGLIPPDTGFALHYAQQGGLGLSEEGITGTDGSLPLTLDPAGLPASVTEKFPHLAGYAALRLGAGDLGMVPEVLKGQLALSATDAQGGLLDATSVQIPGVLDDLYIYDGDLGVVWDGSVPTLKLWAPTAQNVTLHLYADAGPATGGTPVTMSRDDYGVWSATGDSSWYGQFYLYQVDVFAPSTGNVEQNFVTDPYSLSLAADSTRSQIIDMSDPSLQPSGWASFAKPPLPKPEDVVLYELHVRDFSWTDPGVSEANRGTFRAFTEGDSYGMSHLRALADAGLTHIHLLPSFDIATVPERREDQVELDFGSLEGMAPDSEDQQATVTAVEDQDGFNWGYDPYHYTVPEGSYSTDPDGSARVLEFREMVQSLNESGLRVIMDVVYNHTNSAGQNDKSVLDKVVPGYYHRLSGDGAIEQSSCCPNTASEHAMMEKLMVDSLVTWATAYKVDGFRFDLMGHHMLSNMEKVRETLDALTVAEHGVDGEAIYVYGEGWNFGEVANNARGVNAVQANVAGSGIGSFNDRIRDSVRGGGPFSGLQEQGFTTGLAYDPNATDQGSLAEQEDRLKLYADRIRTGLAGGLADYPFTDRFGSSVLGSQVDYNGQASGYTQDPQEIINYVAAHDNETLFDAIQLKVPQGTAMADRVRVQNLSNAIVAFAQGVPFFHAGQDMLRSKSMDRDSFNSGDWFNRLDFTYTVTGWGQGLPVASKNLDNWPIFGPLLADATLAPQPTDIVSAAEAFRDFLAVRNSSGLYRLPTKQDVIDRLGFLNVGPDQIPGVIVMKLSDDDGAFDRQRTRLVTIFNARNTAEDFSIAEYAGAGFRLHPVLASSTDSVVASSGYDADTATFTVPARTTAVYELVRPLRAQIELLGADVDAAEASGSLNAGQAETLRKSLRRAERFAERGAPLRSLTFVKLFATKVTLFQANGHLDPEVAAALRSEAFAVCASILQGF